MIWLRISAPRATPITEYRAITPKLAAIVCQNCAPTVTSPSRYWIITIGSGTASARVAVVTTRYVSVTVP
jgi:hypothetical protein